MEEIREQNKEIMHKVLRITNRFNLGGPTLNVGYLSKFMEDKYETLLIGGTNDKSEENSLYILENLGLNPIQISSMKREICLKNDLIAYNKIKKIIKEFKPDIVHTHASKAGTLGRYAAHNMKVPVILHTFHGHVFDSYFNNRKADFFIKLERYLAKKTDAIITLSKNQFEDIVYKYQISEAKKTHIINLGFDISKFSINQEEKRKQFREKYNISDNQIAIGIIGRLVPVKNHALFVRVLKKLIENHGSKIRAFFVGDGESRQEIEKLLTSLNISFSNSTMNVSEQVIFTSWEKDIDVVHAGLDIVALTSKNEGTPVSIIEAMAAGRAVVSTKVGGVDNIIEHEVSGMLSSICIDDFLIQTDLLINNPELRSFIGLNAKRKVETRFHYTRLVKEMDELYQKLLSNKSI